MPTIPRLTSNRAAWIAILIVALCARLAAGVWWQSRLGERTFFFGDSQTYWELARTIAMGEPYQYLSPDAKVFRTPGYPALLAPLFLVFGERPPLLAARALSAVLGVVAVGLAGWWATQLFDARTGRITGWIAALYPGSVSLGVFVLSEAPFCPLMLAQLGLWTAAWRANSSGRFIGLAIAAGIAAAGAVLMRPSWLLFTPFAVILGVAFFQQRMRQLTLGVGMSLAIVACLLPWWIRNATVTGRFVPTTLQVGASLYDGMHAGATGASDMQFVPVVTQQEHDADDSGSSDIFEYRVDRRMWRESWAWVQQDPSRAAELVGIKFLRMWNFWPNEPAFRGWTMRLVMLVTYVPLMLLGLVGVWRFTSRGWPYALAWVPAIYLTLLHVIFVSSLRYREPALMALVPLAAGVLAEWLRRTTHDSAIAEPTI